MATFGWGSPALRPPAAADAAAAAAGGGGGEGERIEAIALVTNRASAPSLGEFLAELYNSELLSDITICSEDGQAIKCHKLVLIRWSAPLRRMLCGDMREAREKHITLHGVDGEVLQQFLRFLYTCNCSIAPDKLVGLAAMADQYDVTLLQQLCMEAIRVHASNHRCCCAFYRAAKEIQQQDIINLTWEHLASNLSSLVRQHDVFVQLELEDVLRLCSRPDRPTAGGSSSDSPGLAGFADVGSNSGGFGGGAGSSAEGWAAGGIDRGSQPGQQPNVVEVQQQLQQQLQQLLGQQSRSHLENIFRRECHQTRPPPSLHEEFASSFAGSGSSSSTGMRQGPRRPEYALFLALMAWLRHDPARQQHKQLLLDCLDFDQMNSYELSQLRFNPHVQADAELKELLLDAYSRRLLAQSQQPVYHMAPPRGW